MYNIWDLISRYIPLVGCLKLESRKGLMIAILGRFLLIPAYYFTAKYGDQGWMIVLTSFLGLTNGYLTVCFMTVAPKGYKVREVRLYSTFSVQFWSLAFCFLMLYCLPGSFCRVLSRMRWAICLCCFSWEEYSLVLLSIGCGQLAMEVSRQTNLNVYREWR